MRNIFTVLFMLAGTVVFCQIGGVGVNATGNPPDPSAILDLSTNNKGFLLPRLSQTQRDAIPSPATGLFIYNTDCNVVNFNAGTPSVPNWVTMNSSNALIAGVSISANPVGAVCSGTSVSFSATPTAGINSPTYQWQVNGGNVGSNSSTYTNSGLNNGDVVTCILSSSQACVTGSPATSNSITMTVNPAPSTPGSITGNTSVCANSTGNIYSVSPVAGAASYNWTVPGDAAITSGAGNTSITITFGSSSGYVSVAATNSCGTSPQVNDAVTVTSIPATPGTITGPGSVCANATGRIYSVSSVSQATSYNWTVPAGASIISNSDTTITVDFGSNPTGNVSVSATNLCGTGSANTLYVSQTSICPPFVVSYNGGLQTFTVPSGVTSLTIEAFGAQGGNHSPGQAYASSYCGCNGGLGADILGTFTVTPGQVLEVIVGGQGIDQPGSNSANGGAGGGGGTFVYTPGPNLLIAAGGGGGGALYDDAYYYGYPNGPLGVPGQSGNCGSESRGCYAGGCNGNNGSGDLAGNGWNTIMSNPAGIGYGGYGGAGSAEYHGGGGGGGYSGGGGDGASAGCGAVYGDGGGGGGSYNSGTNQTNNSGVQSGNGQVVFTW